MAGNDTDRPDLADLVIVGYALLAALCRPLTPLAALAALLVGVALLVARVRRPVRVPSAGARPARAAWQWGALLALGAGWEVVAVVWGNDARHPTLSLLLDPALESYPVRALGWLAWLSAGRWLLTR